MGAALIALWDPGLIHPFIKKGEFTRETSSYRGVTVTLEALTFDPQLIQPPRDTDLNILVRSGDRHVTQTGSDAFNRGYQLDAKVSRLSYSYPVGTIIDGIKGRFVSFSRKEWCACFILSKYV